MSDEKHAPDEGTRSETAQVEDAPEKLVWVKCPKCEGKTSPAGSADACPDCEGNGEVVAAACALCECRPAHVCKDCYREDRSPGLDDDEVMHCPKCTAPIHLQRRPTARDLVACTDEQFLSSARSFAAGVIGGPDVRGHVERLAKLFADFYREGWEDALLAKSESPATTGLDRKTIDHLSRDLRCPDCGKMMTNHVVLTRHENGPCDESFTGPPLSFYLGDDAEKPAHASLAADAERWRRGDENHPPVVRAPEAEPVRESTSPKADCTCGPDYQDEVCPHHGRSIEGWATLVAELRAEAEVLRSECEKWDRKFHDRRREDLKAKIERRAERIRDEKRRQWGELKAKHEAEVAALREERDALREIATKAYELENALGYVHYKTNAQIANDDGPHIEKLALAENALRDAFETHPATAADWERIRSGAADCASAAEPVKPDSIEELAQIIESAGAVVYFHDIDCPATKGGACTKECGPRAYARAGKSRADSSGNGNEGSGHK